jgi:hypothetical protein
MLLCAQRRTCLPALLRMLLLQVVLLLLNHSGIRTSFSLYCCDW